MSSVLQIKLQWQDYSYHDDNLYDDPILENESVDLEKHQEGGVLDIHMEPLDKDDAAERCKALVLDIRCFPGQAVAYQLGTGQDKEELLGKVHWGMLGTSMEVEQGRKHRGVQGCTQVGRQGLMGSLMVVVVEEDLKQKEEQINTPRQGKSTTL